MSINVVKNKPQPSKRYPFLKGIEMKKLFSSSHCYQLDECGSGTINSMFVLAILAVVAGISIDGANGWRETNKVQIAADAAALAAAAHLDDIDLATEKAVEVAALNLGGDTTSVTSSDIFFGKWDEDTESVVALAEGEDESYYNAVRVQGIRSDARSNSVGTYLLRLVGVDTLSVGAHSVALSETETKTIMTSGSTGACLDSLILSTTSVSGGGGNSFDGGVCIHGKDGVHFGGNDYFSETTRVTAEDENHVQIYSPRSDSASMDLVVGAASIEPKLLNDVDEMFDERWSAFYGAGGTTYSGNLAPSFVKDPNTGAANIVQKDGYWSIQPGEVEPYTIYVVNGGAQFSGALDADNVMFMVNGYFGVGGGFDLHFTDVAIFGTQVNLAGNVSWGSEEATCDESRYSAYIFGKDSVSMGGWGSAAEVNGVVVVSPSVNPGGGMNGNHVYVETHTDLQLGGSMTLTGCSNEVLESEWDLAEVESEEAEVVVVRQSKLKY